MVIILAFIGAFGLAAWFWEDVIAPRRRSHDTEFDFDDEDLVAGDVHSAAALLEAEHSWWDISLEALEAEPVFQRAVAELATTSTDVDEVVALSRDTNGWVASMALAALASRTDVPNDWVTWALRNPDRPSLCEDRLLLRALAIHADRPAIASVLPALESVRDDVIAEFVTDRIARGEVVGTSTFDKVSREAVDGVESFIDRFEGDLGSEFREAFETWRARRHLLDVGRIWERPFDEPPALLAGRRRELVEIVVAALEQSPPHSVLLVGEHGVGKSALIRAALERIDEEAIVFETTAAQINAGAVYVGELEGRVKTLVDSVAGQHVVWVVPELQGPCSPGNTPAVPTVCSMHSSLTSSRGRSRSWQR